MASVEAEWFYGRTTTADAEATGWVCVVRGALPPSIYSVQITRRWKLCPRLWFLLIGTVVCLTSDHGSYTYTVCMTAGATSR